MCSAWCFRVVILLCIVILAVWVYFAVGDLWCSSASVLVAVVCF